MSAYLVADETINRVVEWLYWEVTRSPYLQEQLEEVFGIDTSVYQWYVQFGKLMFALNIACVEAWYGEGEARHFRELSYHYTPAHGSAVQVLKSLQCWLYQCAEGEVVKSPLYQFFRAVVEPHLMSKIIRDLPDYEAAAWG